jgi:hypothetical protein
MHATCPTYLILLDFMTLICGEEKRPSAPHNAIFFSPTISSLLGSNILLITLFSDTLSLCSSPNASSLSLALQPRVGLGLLFP